MLALASTCVAAVLVVKRFRLLELYISRYHLLPGKSISGFLRDESGEVRTAPKPTSDEQETLAPVP